MANTISGNAGLAGAQVYCIGAFSSGAGTYTTVTTTADGFGAYTLAALPAGVYQVTPYSPGYRFTAPYSIQTIVSSNITGVNFTATAIGQTGVWQRQGIVMIPNGTDFNGGSPTSGTEEPTVTYDTDPQLISPNGDGKVFKMWFAGEIHIFYAESNDGYNWTRQVAPVFATQLGNPRVWRQGSTYYLYCTTGNFLGGNIDLYTSATGTSFTLADSAVIPASPGVTDWDHNINDFQVVAVSGGVWYGLYTASPAPTYGQWNTGLATSSDGITWVKHVGNPVLPNLFSTSVYNVGGTYYAWGTTAVFTGNIHQPFGLPSEGGFASSPDLINWSGVSNVLQRTLVNEGFGTTDGQTGTYGSLVEVNGKVYWYYTTSGTLGYAGLGFNLQLSTFNGTMAQLIATNQQVYIPPTSPLSVSATASGGGSGSTQTPSASLNVATGDLVVVYVRSGLAAGTITSVTDDAPGGSNIYTPLTAETLSTVFGPMQFFYAKNAVGKTPLTVTVTFGQAQTYSALFVWDIAGADATNPFDGQGAAAYDLAHQINSPTTSQFTTNYGNEIVLSAVTDEAVNASYTSSGRTLPVFDTMFPAGAGNLFCGSQHSILDQPGTNITASFTDVQHRSIIVAAAFKAATQTTGISGNAGVAGATIVWTGLSSGSTTADGSGNYSTGFLVNGTYTITPSKTGYTFSPTSASETVSGSDVAGVNFTAKKSGSQVGAFLVGP